MSGKIWIGLIGIFAMATSCLFGFIAGFQSIVHTDSAARGAISLAILQTLSAGETEKAKLVLEHEIDSALFMYSYVDEAWWAPLYDSGLLFRSREQDEEYVRRIAVYRSNHVGPYSSAVVENESVLVAKHDARIKAMVEKYGRQ